jgi:hypothetical protein
LKAVEDTSYAFHGGAAAMDAMKDKTLAQGELLGLHTQNPDDGANVKQRIMTTLTIKMQN